MAFIVFNPNDIAATYRLFETDVEAGDYYDALHRSGKPVLAARVIPRSRLDPTTSILSVLPVDTNVQEASEKEPVKDSSKWDPHVIESFTYVPSTGRNDCPVVAVANLFQMPYMKAKVLCFHHGWSSVRGMPDGFMQVIADKLGYEIQFRKDLCHRSVKSLADNPPAGCFIVTSPGHVMPCINGNLYNWEQVRHSYIQEVFEIRPFVSVKDPQGDCA